MKEAATRNDTSAEASASPPAGADGAGESKSDPSRRAARPQMHPHVGVLPALQSLASVLTVALFIMTFTVQPIRIPSGSMEPTLLTGDFLLMNRQSTSSDQLPWMPPTGIRREDVVVFHDPIDDPAVHLVKRVIGLPGDRIHLHGNVVYINDRPLKESYAVYRPAAPDSYRDDFPSLSTMDARVDTSWWIRMGQLVHAGEMVVPARSYFVLGDNRNESDDSRYWGFVPVNDIVGSPLLVYVSVPPRSSTRESLVRWDRIFHVVR